MKIDWDKIGERRYETGVDHGVLYKPNDSGVYDVGVAWNGLTAVTESPEGAEATAQYADNMKYLNLISAEDFKATIEALTYPDEFEECNGFASPVPGIAVGQQTRKSFGFAYRTKIGTDLNPDAGFKIHLVYNATAAPSEKAYATVNDSPEAMALSWECSTVPVNAGDDLKPTSTITLDSTVLPEDAMSELLDILYGTDSTEPRLPMPIEVFELFAGGVLVHVTVVAPTETGGVITIPTVTGIAYLINGEVVTGSVTITEDTIVQAVPTHGYVFNKPYDADWLFTD